LVGHVPPVGGPVFVPVALLTGPHGAAPEAVRGDAREQPCVVVGRGRGGVLTLVHPAIIPQPAARVRIRPAPGRVPGEEGLAAGPRPGDYVRVPTATPDTAPGTAVPCTAPDPAVRTRRIIGSAREQGHGGVDTAGLRALEAALAVSAAPGAPAAAPPDVESVCLRTAPCRHEEAWIRRPRAHALLVVATGLDHPDDGEGQVEGGKGGDDDENPAPRPRW